MRARRRQLPSMQAAGRGPASAASEFAPRAARRAAAEAAAQLEPDSSRGRRQGGTGSCGS
eukprot:11807571-Alexandrium_andersonii.AAC.1